ncbi:hypothetical protein [Spirosoma endbachense]|uniref:Lipocalin-like domain-containing protein n=1 Tax=Spirosoma endbachense TaxID=2666025 RepID=A0A6P1VVV4_9BACT|nr:hypothetical protein [Spirosoma endbachense]QHV96498.1 hypothetical protein GJR95_16415 [Spirosoma endbachense]
MKIKHIYLLLVLIAVAFVVGCSKKNDDPVAPDLATSAAGTYVVNSITQSTSTVAIPSSANYTMTLNRVSNNVVDMVYKTSLTGSSLIPSVPLSGTPAVITFQKSYSITATANGNANGDITNGILTFNTVEGGVTYKIVAKK